MLNESIFLSSFSQLRGIFSNDLTILHISTIYILVYVVYKALGRYIYFKTQDHSSKINRTFLTSSLLIILLYSLNRITSSLPFNPEYRWLFALCVLVMLIAPLSIITGRTVWSYKYGNRRVKNWSYYHLPIAKDYYKTSVPKSVTSGNSSESWEEEGVESTGDNIHSDAMLNVLALAVFIFVVFKWSQDSVVSYGYYSYIFSFFVCLTMSSLFIDRSLFSWIRYLEKDSGEDVKRWKIWLIKTFIIVGTASIIFTAIQIWIQVCS